MKNPVSTHRPFSTSAVCLLAFASTVAAQASDAELEQRLAKLERRLAVTPPGQSEASADTSLLQMFRGGEASYSPGRGLTLTAQDADKFAINIGGQVQAGFSWADEDVSSTSSSNFAVWSTRLRFGGNVFKDEITYFVQFDPIASNIGNPSEVVDAWAGYRFSDTYTLRLGQQKMRSGLQADTSMADTDLELATRSIATQAFANQRATGALFEGSASEGKFNWHVGVMNNGTGGLDAGITPGAGFVAAVSGVAIQGVQGNAGQSDVGVTAGASFGSHAGNSEDWSEGDLARTGEAQWIAGATVTQVNESVAAGGDALTINGFGGFKSGSGLAAQAEIWVRDNDDLNRDDLGFYGQVSYTLAKKEGYAPQWGGVLRYSAVDLDTAGEATEIAAGINAYYHQHDLKTQLQVRMIDFENAAGVELADAVIVDLLFTLVF